MVISWRSALTRNTEAIRQPRVDRSHGGLRLSPMPWLFPPRLLCPLVASSAQPKHDSVLRFACTRLPGARSAKQSCVALLHRCDLHRLTLVRRREDAADGDAN